MMIQLRAIALCCAASVVLCQCRCVKASLAFFKDHACEGHELRSTRYGSARPMTLDEFIAANAHRRLPSEILKSRFRVADANRDGTLTPHEMEAHRIRAARNKSKMGNA